MSSFRRLITLTKLPQYQSSVQDVLQNIDDNSLVCKFQLALSVGVIWLNTQKQLRTTTRHLCVFAVPLSSTRNPGRILQKVGRVKCSEVHRLHDFRDDRHLADHLTPRFRTAVNCRETETRPWIARIGSKTGSYPSAGSWQPTASSSIDFKE